MGRLPEGVKWRGGNRGAYYTTVSRRGVRRQIRLGATVDEAREELSKLEQQWREPSKTLVEEAADRWLSEYVARRRNAKGQALASKRVGLYLKPWFGRERRIVDVRAEDLRQYGQWLRSVEWKKGRALSVQTIAHVLSDVRSLFTWAVDVGILSRSPFPRMLLPRVPQSLPEPFSDDEVGQLERLRGADGYACRVAIGTGLRWGELVALRAENLRTGALVIVASKTGKRRRVPVPAVLEAEMSRRIGRLFPFRDLQLSAFSRRVKRLTGIARFHVHRMRDTFACRWLAAGGSLAALQKLLGHSTVTTTERYGALADDMIQREADRIYEQFGTRTSTKAVGEAR